MGKNLSVIVSNVYAPNDLNEEYFNHLKDIIYLFIYLFGANKGKNVYTDDVFECIDQWKLLWKILVLHYLFLP